MNGNFTWDPGEPFKDLNGNGRQDDGEGYDDANSNGQLDRQDLVDNTQEDQPEPFYDGDIYNDTGEPFIDLRDPLTGEYNGRWDPGEPFYDLPSSDGTSLINEFGDQLGYELTVTPTLNGKYDPPNGIFDEYELFTQFNPVVNEGSTQRLPVLYTWKIDGGRQVIMAVNGFTVIILLTINCTVPGQTEQFTMKITRVLMCRISSMMKVKRITSIITATTVGTTSTTS